MDEQQDKIAAVRVINSLHVAWIYCNPATRKKYGLEKKYAFYHADTNTDYILRLEKELQRLQLNDPDDYCIHENPFGEWNIYTLCLADKTSKRLEKLGVNIG